MNKKELKIIRLLTEGAFEKLSELSSEEITYILDTAREILDENSSAINDELKKESIDRRKIYRLRNKNKLLELAIKSGEEYIALRKKMEILDDYFVE